MPKEPQIIISSQDFDRLEHLVDSISPQYAPGLDALRRELDRALVVEWDEIPPDVITMNSTARFIDDTSGKEYELTLAYPDDTHLTQGTVSVLAPVGSALLGLSVGQSIEWQIPGGRTLQLRVLAVTYQPEAVRKNRPQG